MKRFLAFLLVLTALAPAPFDPVMADGYVQQFRHRHGVHVAYAGPDLAYESACSVGWWQTLRYGHVRPQWGVRCYGRRRY